MATHFDGHATAVPAGRGFMADQRFFTRYAIALVAFILFGFIQFELRGFVDIRTAPLFLHVHGAVMVSWLAMFVVQNMLVSGGQIALHRTLGWIGLLLAVAVTMVASYTGITAIKMGIVPPFFSTAQFLALTQTGAVFFAGLVAAAIVRRKQTQWHRRLMLGSMFLITEPALGRLLPMPLLGGEMGEWAVLVVQLVMLAILARHDKKVLGSVHPATKVVLAAVIASHVLISALSHLPPFVAYAQAVAAG
jgi:hypothetical protein